MPKVELPNLNSLVSTYRTFRGGEDIAAAQVADDLGRAGYKFADSKFIYTLNQILFDKPQTAETFFNSITEKFTSLPSSNTQNGGQAINITPEQQLASLVRIYYYDPRSSGSDALESRISDFYIKQAKRSSAYGTIQNNKYVVNPGGLRAMVDNATNEKNKKYAKSPIMMVLVDEPALDIKVKNADKVHFYMNFIPGVMMSQAVPYVDVKLTNSRLKPGAAADHDGYRSQFDHLSPARFLFGTGEQLKPTTENVDKKPGETKDIPQNTPPNNNSKTTKVNRATGMEMFIMPQTLINLDYDDSISPRYNPVINKTAPFGAITSVSINVFPSFQFSSHKTATLSLKVFDRSRLPEIADFLNPALYSSSGVILTYGWRAPAQPSTSITSNAYHEFINNNLLSRELYGVKNSSVSIDNSGVVSITLELFTRGAAELRDVTPTGESITFQEKIREFSSNIARIQKLAQELKLDVLSKTVPEIRGSVLINASLSGNMPELDSKELNDQLAALERILKGNDPGRIKKGTQEYLDLVKRYYEKDPNTRAKKRKKQKFQRFSELENLAKEIIVARLDALKTNKVDFFTYLPGKDKVREMDGDASVNRRHPLSNLKSLLGNSVNNDFGKISFGKLFFTYFNSAVTGVLNEVGDPFNDEYQIFFYNLNKSAGPVAGINIAEFPIDLPRLERAYAKYVISKKGENMSLFNFLEIVRESQFGDMRHPAYGFSDLYEFKDGDYKLRQPEAEEGNEQDINEILTQRLLRANNNGNGEPFSKPVVDFYIESVFAETPTYATHDLLAQDRLADVRTVSNVNLAKKIIRIHVFDRAATPYESVTNILNAQAQGGYVKRIDRYKKAGQIGYDEDITNLLNDELKNEKNPAGAIKAVNNVNYALSSKTGTQFEYVTFRDAHGRPRFELMKNEIARTVPTIIVGAQGGAISNVSYSTNQDANLSTIFILRNSTATVDPSQPNGSALGDLPLRVIPGQLNMSMLGCPIMEYMQQFFVDLGTGTTIDNLYNVVGITHNMSPGKFYTDVKFGFADAYGTYESARDSIARSEGVVRAINEAIPQQPNPPQKEKALNQQEQEYELVRVFKLDGKGYRYEKVPKRSKK